METDKDIIIKAIQEGRANIYYDKRWQYPSTGDDQKKCKMLDVMLNAEQHAGYIICIPYDKKTDSDKAEGGI